MKKFVAGAVGAGVLLAGSILGTPTSSAAARSCTSQSTRKIATHTYQYVPSYKGSTGCLLAAGNKGDGVKSLQRSLNACYGAKLTVDGKFGDKTKKALMRAQKKERIDADGIYGPQSRTYLRLRSTIYINSRPVPACSSLK